MCKQKKPDVPAPKTENDRAFLIMMYEEHAEHARQHESLRATVATIFVALIAGVFTYAGSDPHRLSTSGVLICALSILGWILNVKHNERDSMHRTVLCGFRRSLEKDLTQGIDQINSNFRNHHEAEWPFFSKRVRLHYLWASVYIFTSIIGLLMIFV